MFPSHEGRLGSFHRDLSETFVLAGAGGGECVGDVRDPETGNMIGRRSPSVEQHGAGRP